MNIQYSKAHEDTVRGVRLYDAGEFAAAAECYARAAAQGHVVARCGLGLCYALGRGVHRDLDRAIELWRLAADQGDTKSANNLRYALAVREHDSEQRSAAAEILGETGRQSRGTRIWPWPLPHRDE